MGGGAAPARRLEALGTPATEAPQPLTPSQDHAGALVAATLQAGHQSLAGDGAKLIGEGPIEDKDDHGEDPLTDGRCMLQDKALMDKESATWRSQLRVQ